MCKNGWDIDFFRFFFKSRYLSRFWIFWTQISSKYLISLHILIIWLEKWMLLTIIFLSFFKRLLLKDSLLKRQNLRGKIIVSYTHFSHQIIKICQEIRYFEEIWVQKIQKQLRYRLFKKKPNFGRMHFSWHPKSKFSLDYKNIS